VLRRLVLASASPRRTNLLAELGLPFEVRPADVDETPHPGESAEALVARLARAKAEAGAGAAGSDAIVLGADTTVVVDGAILGKPRDDAEAAWMLGRLAGRRHDVLTGVSVRHGAHEVGRVESTAVWVSALTTEDIAWYVASGEGRDKAGAYAIQGLASRFIPRIDGSYANVVGLPVAAVAELLRSVLASHPETGYSDV